MLKNNRQTVKFLPLCVMVLLLAVLVSSAAAKAPKYVFLFIGDGMGIPQRSAANEFAGKKLLVDTFPYQGITTTHAADRFITGSAAAGTAMASGLKTNIGVVGMGPALKPVKTLGEMARDTGMKVGIVSSVSIDHATPATFYAHVPKRGQYYDIDVALAESGFDYFGGGTIKDPENERGNASEFKGNAWDLIKENGYKVVKSRRGFENLSKKDGKIFATNEWIQNSGALPYQMDTTGNDISLSEFTEKGIEVLDNDNGFFMMVEGGKIDWACHANDATAAIKDTIEFNRAVGKAYDFYKNHPDETLIVVTGDHECGGMTLGFAGTKYQTYFEVLNGQKTSFREFTNKIVSSFKEKEVTPSFEDMKPHITDYFGLKFKGEADDPMVLANHEITRIIEAYQRSMNKEEVKSGDPRTYVMYGGYDPLSVTLTHVLNQKGGIAWTSYKHTGVPVTTSAVGIEGEKFQGMYDNTDIALKIMETMGLGTTAKYAAAAR
ncbi:MAG: alkaline phosphatase [Desulfarculaceae bacterium]|nr:alkaline phosphatase [Desulfarculaceae bacterium]